MRKILVVEDDPILRETYEIILSTQPYVCDFAENGNVALEKCQRNNYDLILLDIMMPVMSGIEFLEQVQTDPSIVSKVMLMSNLSAGKELERAKALGVNKHILKSDMSPSQLISLIRYQFEA